MALTPDSYSCFNGRKHPRGHFFSALELHKAGVWIGCLAAEKQDQPFRNMPSFKALKRNCKKFSTPYPPGIPGVARDGERYAVCAGCCGENSYPVKIEEIQYVNKTKLVIMRLDGTDDEGMFCILLPQPNDRSLRGLQAYRPYEPNTSGGQGKAFRNSFMLLSHRNAGHQTVQQTLEAVRGVLEPERRNIVASSAPLKRKQRNNANERDGHTKRQQRELSPTLQTRQPDSGTTPDNATQLHIGREITATVEPDVISTDTPAPSNIRLVCSLIAGEVEYEYDFSLDKCQTFSKLRELLLEDAKSDPEVAEVLSTAQLWRFTYQLPGSLKKAITSRAGEEEFGLERVRKSLAHLSGGDKVEVHVRILR